MSKAEQKKRERVDDFSDIIFSLLAGIGGFFCVIYPIVPTPWVCLGLLAASFCAAITMLMLRRLRYG